MSSRCDSCAFSPFPGDSFFQYPNRSNVEAIIGAAVRDRAGSPDNRHSLLIEPRQNYVIAFQFRFLHRVIVRCARSTRKYVSTVYLFSSYNFQSLTDLGSSRAWIFFEFCFLNRKKHWISYYIFKYPRWFSSVSINIIKERIWRTATAKGATPGRERHVTKLLSKLW